MTRTCKWILGVFALLYLAALALFAIGSLGLFGSERDPLAAVFLMPLGLPWNLLSDPLPEALYPWLGAGAPLVNLLLLWIICRGIAARGAGRR
jgi:hypothetical protein